MNKKWNCDCQAYLEEELEALEEWQINAKKLVEKLLSCENCPYHNSEQVNVPSKSSSPIPGEHITTTCEKCNKSFKLNQTWIDKSRNYWATDSPWKNHLIKCKGENSEEVKKIQFQEEIQKQINNLEKKIKEVENNSDLRKKEKKKLLEELNSQLSALKDREYQENYSSLSSRERERERESNSNNSNKNYLPWILGGLAGLGLIASLVWYFTKKEAK